MCAEDSVNLEMHFRRKLGTGLFGGEGFILQKLTGPGTAFVEISGEVREYTLQAGQRLKVDPGHLAMYEPSVSYDISDGEGRKQYLVWWRRIIPCNAYLDPARCGYKPCH